MTTEQSFDLNWIEDENPHRIPKPPSWALKMFYDFDADLVLIPSRNAVVKGETPSLILARRAKWSAGLGKEALFENKHPDTNMLWRHGLVPISPLRSKSNFLAWTERDVQALLGELRARDTRAQADAAGGVDALVDKIEAGERAAEKRIQSSVRDNFYHRARDAWRSLKARTGQRSKRASDYHGVAKA